MSNDGCSSTCIVETGWTCTTNTNPSVCTRICGDGKNLPGEACDDGNVDGSSGCKADCSGPVPGYLC